MALYGALSALSTIYIRTLPPQRPSCNCGDTIDEAISNSCIYDEMAAAWLPPACRDDELSSQFSQSGPNSDGSWTYYGDKNKTVSMTAYDLSQLPLTGGHFFATHEWHVVHCSYYWKKMARARELGTVLEKRYDTDMHIGHCEMMFLKRDPLDKIVTEAGVSLHSDVLVVAKPEEHKHDQHGDSEIDVEED
ncbi:hypothetical protein OHC33_009828 [Knufia fluminis]|uniref:Uncharacterized protein n=1 Tax=Knufia fluminis TaxID=191047 RepID=A0AAN8IIG3_9EURO|nr:hypothetical protein OHC33_009828 [Knufia fluminis]